MSERQAGGRSFRVQLLPHEREVLQKWNCTPEVQDQLTPFADSDDIATVTLSGVDLMYLISDLNHAIVKRDAYNEDDTIDLAERLEYIEQTGNGELDHWYG